MILAQKTYSRSAHLIRTADKSHNKPPFASLRPWVPALRIPTNFLFPSCDDFRRLAHQQGLMRAPNQTAIRPSVPFPAHRHTHPREPLKSFTVGIRQQSPPQPPLGQQAETALARAGITSNKNPVPFDARSPSKWTGLRLGVSAATTRGFGTADMEALGECIADLLHAEALSDAGHTLARARVRIARLAQSGGKFSPA